MANWLTPKLAAAYCHVDAVTLRRAVKRGALQAFRVNGGRSVRFRVQDLDLWLSAHPVGVARG